MPYQTRAVYCPHTGKGSLQVTCDLAVGAVIVDTVEACVTYSAMCRFHCRGDSDASQTHAGCLLCHTPPYYYDWASTSLRPEHVRMRNVTETERIRTSGVGTAAGDQARSVAGGCSCYPDWCIHSCDLIQQGGGEGGRVLMHLFLVGLRGPTPAFTNKFWDSRFPHGDFYSLWGLDFLHHMQLGTALRLGVNQLKVSCSLSGF